MAISDRINSIKEHIGEAYEVLEEKQATIPENKNIENLADSILSITGGGDEPDIKYTGHVDREGLRQIGWSDEQIDDFQKNGVFWDEENDDKFKLTEAELSLNVNPSTRFLPINDTSISFQQANYALSAIAYKKFKSLSYTFNQCHNLTYIYEIDISDCVMVGGAFQNCFNLRTIRKFIPTTKILNYGSMFTGCYSLKDLNFLDTSNANSLASTFKNCRTLREVPLLNTSNVKDMSNTFENCYSLRKVANLDTKLVTNFSYTFYYCYSLEEAPFFDTSNATQFSDMFDQCSSLKKVPKYNLSKATSLSYMFRSCSSLKEVPEFDYSSVTNISQMFNGCQSLNHVSFKNTQNVKNVYYLFASCHSLMEIKNLNFSSVTDISYAFRDCYLIPVIDISTLDVSKVTSFSGAFSGCGTKSSKSFGAYEDGIPYIYVKDEEAQNWVLTASNGHPTTWSTANVVIVGSEQDTRNK